MLPGDGPGVSRTQRGPRRFLHLESREDLHEAFYTPPTRAVVDEERLVLFWCAVETHPDPAWDGIFPNRLSIIVFVADILNRFSFSAE